jgi:hypothetical protein
MNNITQLSRSNGAAQVSASQRFNVFKYAMDWELVTSSGICMVVAQNMVLKKDLFHSHGGML